MGRMVGCIIRLIFIRRDFLGLALVAGIPRWFVYPHPMTDEEFSGLVARIRQALGCGQELALDYAKGLGESPEVVHGKMLVRNDEGRIIARVPVEVWQMGQLSSSSAV